MLEELLSFFDRQRTQAMRRSGVTFVLAVFLVGTIASDAALARSGGRGGGHGRGHHASGSMTSFQRSAPRAAVVVTAPVVYGGYRAPGYYYPPLSYYPSGTYARYPYYGMGPYYVPGPYETPGPAYLPYAPPEYAPEYIERGPDAAVPQVEPAPAEQSAATYWWFCPGANNYYPYVKTCPSGWQQVRPQ